MGWIAVFPISLTFLMSALWFSTPNTPQLFGESVRRVKTQEKVVGFYKTNQEVTSASTKPENPKLKEILKKLSAETVTGKGEIYLISQHSYEEVFKLYEKFPPPREFVASIKITGEELEKLQKELKNFGILNAKLNAEKNITLLFKIILAGAMQANASDIHIETEEKKITLRYRVDGVLHIVATLPKKIWPRLDSRVKNIAGLKINITEKPQDRRITVYLKE